MAFAEIRSTPVAHKNTFRVLKIDGALVEVLWEGDSMGQGEVVWEKAAEAARSAGTDETIVLDGFKLAIERHWVARLFTSRPPSPIPIRRLEAAKAGAPRILYLPLEFPTWLAGGHSWSYAAGLAYARGLRDAGADVTVIGTPLTLHAQKILRGKRFDQVWVHCHPRHLSDIASRSWIAEVAPVRLLLCGETVSYGETESLSNPWFSAHKDAFEKWAPFVTHAAFVDPGDAQRTRSISRTMWWKQAVPRAFVKPVNESPRKDAALFVGTLYAPRDRWVFELGNLVDQVDSPESDAFCWLFEKSHEWMQAAFEGTGTRSPWWRLSALKAYNRLQDGLRRYAFDNFLEAVREGVAIVNLPSMVKSYSGRVIEGMAAGRPVLSQMLPEGHEPLFQDGTEILHYGSVEELAADIQRLKASPKMAVSIASAARSALLAHHTIEIRARELLAFAEDRASKTGG